MQTIPQEVLQVVNAIKADAMWALIVVLTSTGVALFLKSILESTVAYFLFMINKRLGINVRVEVRGKKGTIVGYNKRWIFIKTDDKDEIIIPIKNWQSERWMLLDPMNHKNDDSQ
jgi:hypothetical protein